MAYPPLTYPLKIDPGKGDSYWKASFLGAKMLVSGRVSSKRNFQQHILPFHVQPPFSEVIVDKFAGHLPSQSAPIS